MPVAKDDMVEYGNLQRAATLDQLYREAQVLRGRVGESGRVVVGDDDVRGSLADGFSEDLAGVGQGLVDGADTHDPVGDQPIFDIEQQHGKLLLAGKGEFGAEHGADCLGAIDDRAVARAGEKDAAAQFDRSEQCRRLGWSNAGVEHQFGWADVAQVDEWVAPGAAEGAYHLVGKTEGTQLSGGLATTEQDGHQFSRR